MTDELAPVRQDQFLETQEYRRFAEFCDACRRYRYIGLCHGPPGVGKTLSARHYARWERLEPALRAQRLSLGGRETPEIAACRTLVYTPTMTTTPHQLGIDVQALCRDLKVVVARATDLEQEPGLRVVHTLPERIELLIVDEADRLKFPALEQLRDLYDRGGFGLVLIGMPGLEKRLMRFAQLYSRVGFVHQYRALNADALRLVLAHKWQQLDLTLDLEDFSTAEAVAAVLRITSGNFRLVERLFSQIERILEINGLRAITPDVVDAARHSLVIGTSG